ncbi:contact-dependent growth inhibition system immunity protein [Pseudomonas yamanorum]|uniref:contact-dependent growth inhibition system immunity protein n=1 Tax=Pseudomonas yamanorum TaxID=515393 RepID=UPI003F74CA0D
MSKLNIKSWAYVKFTNDFIFIETYSGYFNCLPDPEGVGIFLSHLSDDSSLGQSILDALAVSRMIDPKESPEFFDFRGRVAIQYNEWIANAMMKFEYKTKRALFKDMKSCSIDAFDGVITIRPSHHEKLEAWSGKGITEKDFVVISTNSSPDEIGVSLRLAFSRCT